ncbi:MAG: SRPBCC family protein [Betaproteobacteria bacterium]
MLKIILIVLVVALVAFLLFVTTRPDTFRVTRSATIQAAPEKLFPMINDMKAFNQWNPYVKKDPKMKGVYSGPTAGPGATYTFEGNKDAGKGSIAVTDSSPNSKVVMQLKMTDPVEISNVVTFTLQPEGAATRLTWAMDGPVPYLFKIVHLFMDMDKMVGNDYETGLASLKALAEAR